MTQENSTMQRTTRTPRTPRILHSKENPTMQRTLRTLSLTATLAAGLTFAGTTAHAAMLPDFTTSSGTLVLHLDAGEGVLDGSGNHGGARSRRGRTSLA